MRRVYVSALTKPEDAFARRDPKSLSGAIYDRWYCSPYPQSIAFQLAEAIPHSHAEQIRQVSQNEGAVLTRIEGLIFLITLAALFASALAVSAAMATTMFERRAEVGLMKALGAGKLAVASIFFAEATLLALIGGLAGFVVGAGLAHQIGHSIFNSDISIPPVLLPVILAIAVMRDVRRERCGHPAGSRSGSGICVARGTMSAPMSLFRARYRGQPGACSAYFDVLCACWCGRRCCGVDALLRHCSPWWWLRQWPRRC